MGVKLATRDGRGGHRAQPVAEKKEDGLRLGADHYYATSDPDTFKASASSFDLILNTVSAELDLDAYLPAQGRRCPGRASACPRADAGSPAPSRSSAHRRSLSGLDDRRHPARPRRCSTSAPSTASAAEIELHRAGPRQRGVRAGAGQRRALPLRDRHGVSGLVAGNRLCGP